MPSFGALGRSRGPSAGDPAFADTIVIPVLVPATLDRPAVLLRPARPRMAAPRRAAHRRIGPVVGGALALALALLGGLALDGDRPPLSAGDATAAAPRPAEAAPAGSGRAGTETVGQVAAAVEVGGTVAPQVEASVPADVPSAVVAPRSELRPPRPPANPNVAAGGMHRQIAMLAHEWEVAEAMRLRYRELHAQGLVSWEAWRAQENEALRLRRQLQGLKHRVLREQGGAAAGR